MSDPVPKEEMVSPSQESPPEGLFHRLSNRRTMMVIGIGSLLLLLIAAAGIIYYVNQHSTSDFEPATPPSMADLAAQFPEISDLLLDEKLDSVYKQFLIAYQEGGPEAAYDLAKKRGILNDANEVRLTLELDTTNTAELQAGLEAAGIKVTAVSENLMDIAIPVEVLEASLESDEPGRVFMDISGLEHIKRLRIPEYGIEDFGDVETEGVPVVGADAWQAAGFTGAGVKIGVLDIGFDKYRSLSGTDLPANVIAQSFRSGLEIDQTGTEHGSAVAEIIYDIAPEAELVFAAYQTYVEKQLAIDWLLSQDVDIISSSTGTVVGARDGTSPTSVQLDEAVAQGVLWVNSSGNTALSHYRGVFTDNDGDGYHEFYQGDEIMGFMTPGPVGVALNWDDWENGTQDFDMYIFDQDSNLIASSENTQNGPDSGAFEVIYYEFEREVPYFVVVKKIRADRAVTFDLLMNDGILEYYSAEYSLSPPADAYGAFTVGATKWEDDQLEDYSSQGPTDDGRVKPDITAPTGVSSAAYGDTWVGTSASCPHVTGAAALVMQAFPDYTPDQVKEFLINRAVDLGNAGPDSQTGYGRLWLGDPVESAGVEPLPPAVEPTAVTEPTEVAIKGPAATSRPTSTPDLEKQPVGSADKTDLTGMLILFACIGLPGLLGLGGIGILGAVLLTTRSRNAQRTPAYVPWTGAGQPRPVMPSEPPLASAEEASPVKKVVCPNCGRPYQPGTKFCTKCGYELAQGSPVKAAKPQFCSKCGSALRSDSKFCPNCGHKIR